ncbi:MAG: hypothetical protein O3C10_11980 [Chloroflexi bacterium]|nr:hypothetical protein [Chloroflexota bacterium]
MRIERVFLDSFRRFESRDITGLGPGLNVVVGSDKDYLNSFRDFVRQVMFGFDPKTTSIAGSLATPTGGVLELVHSDGSPLTIERYLRGQESDAVQVTVSSAGEPRPDSDPLRGLSEIDRKLWQGKFEISPGQLNVGPSRLLACIRSLFAGAEGLDILAVHRAFEEEEETLVRSLTVARAARQVAEERFRRAAQDFDSYVTADGQRADLHRQINDSDIELSVVRARFHHIAALEESRPAWSRMSEIQTAVSGMPRFAYLPREPLTLLEELRSKERELQSEIGRGDGDDSPRVAELEALESSVRDDFPTAEARHLLALREDYAEAVRELPVQSERMESLERRFQEGLARLGNGWDETKLDAVEDSPAIRDRIEKLEADIETRRTAHTELTRTAEESEARLDSERERAANATRRFESLGEPAEITVETATQRLDIITRARAEMVERAEARRSLGDSFAKAVEARPRRAISAGRLIPLVQLGMSGAFAVVGIVIWALAMSASDGSAMRTGQVVGLTGVIGVLMSIAILEVQRRHSRAQYEASAVLHELAARTAQELEKEMETRRVQLAYTEECLRSSLEELGLTRDLPLAQLDLERGRVTRELDRRLAFDEASAAVEETADVVDRAARDAEGAAETATDAKNHLDAMVDDRDDILISLGLQPELGSNAVRESLDLIAELRQVRTEVRVLQIRVPAMRLIVVEVEAGLSEIAEVAALPEFAAHAAAPVLEQLKEAREEANRRQDKIGRTRRDGEAWAAHRAVIEREIDDLRHERQELLDLVGAEDKSAFREIATREEERRRLSSELEEIRRNTPNLTGPAGREAEVELQESEPEALAAERDALNSRVSRLEELQERLATRIRSLDERREELSGPPRTLDYRIEIHQLDEQMKGLAKKLATVRTARRLVTEAAGEYGSTAQQNLLGLTGEYLKRLSGGELVKIRPAATEPGAMFGGVEVVSLNGHAERVDDLGSDLLRQVFLASKLAIAHEQTESGEPLPVLIHDLGHDLGPDHARHFAAAAEELSHNTQVILLTDHPGTVDRAREAATSVAPLIFDLGLQGRQIRLSA